MKDKPLRPLSDGASTPASFPFASAYGHFSEDGTEYIITRPDPPRPWYNHFGHAGYAVRFSQTGRSSPP